MTLLDANIFLRALVRPVTEEDRARFTACAALFQRLDSGAEEATTLEAVIATVCYVLRSPRQYGLEPADIAGRLRSLLTVRGLRLPHKATYLRALELWTRWPRLDFDDVLLVAHSERMGNAPLLSYDRGLDAVPGVIRLEPLP